MVWPEINTRVLKGHEGALTLTPSGGHFGWLDFADNVDGWDEKYLEIQYKAAILIHFENFQLPFYESVSIIRRHSSQRGTKSHLEKHSPALKSQFPSE